jgi:dipeptidase
LIKKDFLFICPKILKADDMKNLIRLIFICGLILVSFSIKLKACTSYLVTKGASFDGSTMISYAADSHIRYGELYWHQGGDWPAGTMITLYDRGTNKALGQIPQASKTYKVVGFLNEFQVSMGETTFGGREELYDTTGIVDYGSLMFLALQRSKNAREAIKTIIQLTKEYGYASSGESFSIADQNEVWIMEIIGKGTEMVYDKKLKKYFNKNKGIVFVAIKIPDGYVSAHANHSRITKFPLRDGIKSITSEDLDKIFNPEVEVVYAYDVIEFARSKGFFNGKDEEFSFSDAYAPMNFEAARFCELRVWAFFNRINSEMNKYWDIACGNDLTQRLPLYIKPDKKLKVSDLFAAKRDYLQGTELDMSKDAGAGPFGLPYRWRPLTWKFNDKEYFNERVTVTQQTGFSFVSQMRNWLPDEIGGIYWFGVDDAGSCVYVPFYCGITRPAKKWAQDYGSILKYVDDAAFWVFNRVAHFKYLFYDRVQPEIENQQQMLEQKFFDYQPAIEIAALELFKNDPRKAKEFLTDYSCNMADNVVDYWNEFGNFLMVKYLDGNVKHEMDGKFIENGYGYPKAPMFPGYPPQWKEDVVNKTGDKFILK